MFKNVLKCLNCAPTERQKNGKIGITGLCETHRSISVFVDFSFDLTDNPLNAFVGLRTNRNLAQGAFRTGVGECFHHPLRRQKTAEKFNVPFSLSKRMMKTVARHVEEFVKRFFFWIRRRTVAEQIKTCFTTKKKKHLLH